MTILFSLFTATLAQLNTSVIYNLQSNQCNDFDYHQLNMSAFDNYHIQKTFS